MSRRSPLLDHQINKHGLFEKLIAKRDAQKVNRSGLKKRLQYLEVLKQRQTKLREQFYTSFSFLPRPHRPRDNYISAEEFKIEFPLLNEYDKQALHLMELVRTQISDDELRIEDMLKQKKSRSKSRSSSSSRSRSSSSSKSSSSSSRSRSRSR